MSTVVAILGLLVSGAGLFIGVLTLGALIWYVLETRKMRLAAESQVLLTRDLSKAASDQVEGMAKPCLNLKQKLRATIDAITNRDGITGSTEIASEDAQFILENVGNGIALNVDYWFEGAYTTVDPYKETKRYFQLIKPGTCATMPEMINTLKTQNECKLICQFDSIGGRRYQSVITMNDHILTHFAFSEIGRDSKQTQ